ncbi:MAG: translation initiation factor IF-3 [Chitinophagaceae bacterium]
MAIQQFRPYRQRRVFVKELEHRINETIDSQQVRLVGDNVENAIYSTSEALKIAKEQQLDLVEISTNNEVPICRIIEYNKFLYEKKKKDKEVKSKNKLTEVKEIRLTPTTEEHDLDFKSKHAEKFLKEGNKVKIMVVFKGRIIQYKERGEWVINKFIEKLQHVGTLESPPILDRRRMFAIILPNANTTKNIPVK